MAKLVNTNEAKEIIGSGKVVLVDFFATWCGPCQMFLPVFDETSAEVTDVEFLKVDIDQETDYAVENKVMGVPTIVAYKDGVEVSRFSGFKSADELKAFIEEVK